MFSHPTNVLDTLGVSAGMHVGDFGTGEGAYARDLARRVGGSGVVYAFDVQKNLVERLAAEARRDRLEMLHPVWADLDELGGTKLPDASLDLAIIANVLFQSEHKDVFVSEVVRVTRPNGRVLIVDWSESFGHLGPHHDHVISKNDARRIAEAAGLVFDREVDAGAHHYGLLFRKTKRDATT